MNFFLLNNEIYSGHFLSIMKTRYSCSYRYKQQTNTLFKKTIAFIHVWNNMRINDDRILSSVKLENINHTI